MSNINVSGIDTSFPTAGRDNDSQGFRTNFSEIVVALETAKDELADLQNKSVLKAALTGSSIDNNLEGNGISNGTYSQFSPVFANRGSATLIDINLGPVQKFVVQDLNSSGGDTFTWANWSSSTDQCSQVRLIFTLSTDLSGTRTVSFGGNIKLATGFPSPLTVSNTKIKVVDAWSVDGGDTIYLNYIGEF